MVVSVISSAWKSRNDNPTTSIYGTRHLIIGRLFVAISIILDELQHNTAAVAFKGSSFVLSAGFLLE